MLPDFKINRFRYQKYLRELAEKKQTRVYTGLILTFLAISFFAFFALRPTLLTIANLIAEIRQKEETVKKIDVKIQQLAQAQASYSQIAPRVYLVDEALPTRVHLTSLLNNIEMAAVQNQASFSSLSFEKISVGEKKGGLQEINFRSSLEGQFENLKSFSEKIFFLRRIIQSSQFALVESTDEEKQFLILSAQLKSFFQGKEGQLP